MGAGCVVAPGRNEAMLEQLAGRFGPRLRPVRLTGDEAADRAEMRQAAPGPVDCVLDILPPQASPLAVRAAAMTVREHGRVALMGGVGMLDGSELPLPYPWLMRNSVTVVGQWMYPRTANGGLVRLVHAGLLDLAHWTATPFALDDVNDAVADAAANGGPFRLTTIRPQAASAVPNDSNRSISSTTSRPPSRR
jgi:alcohol dehydrogenase